MAAVEEEEEKARKEKVDLHRKIIFDALDENDDDDDEQ